jgi:hypothetical protein
MKALTYLELQTNAPSIFAPKGADKMSSRYGFIPTINVIDGLRNDGFHPVQAFQVKARKLDRRPHSKHVIRFRHETTIDQKGVVPEIVLINSHDGSTAYQLRAGIFRMVCANGLIVGSDTFCRRIRHNANAISHVVQAANELIEIVPLSVRRAQEWQDIELNQEEKLSFANQAALLKWDGATIPVQTDTLLAPRRSADNKNDLWTTFNVIQENLLRGGIQYVSEQGQRRTTRPINSVYDNVRINTALWNITENMAQLIAK